VHKRTVLLIIFRFEEEDGSCSKPCVGGDETARECDDFSGSGAGPVSQLFAGPPEEDGREGRESENEKDSGKESQRDQELVDVVGVEVQCHDRDARTAGTFDGVYSVQQISLARWPYLGVCWDIAGATVTVGTADFN